MPALNASTLGQPQTPEALRERTIAGLYEPVQRIVRAAIAVHKAVEAHDLRRLAEADATLTERVEAYLERVQ